MSSLFRQVLPGAGILVLMLARAAVGEGPAALTRVGEAK
jgi:hypothetical protein